MIRREALAAAVRLAAFAAVGLALAATSLAYRPCEPLAAETLVYDVAASCGPAGRVRLSHEARTCGQPPGASLNTPALTVSGAEAVGLPAFGALTVSPPRGIAAGDLYLAGDVALVGAVPPVTVERVCHFAPGEAGALAVTCVGHDAASGCEGTLTPVAEAP